MPADVDIEQFRSRFATLTGFPPMRWQERLFLRFLANDLPAAVDLPTGLGKTAVMAIWYLALDAGADLPRRLVYVVDRRAVVDQATDEAGKIRERLDAGLPVSTLRGRHVDNRDWLANPAARAIIVGTVDMIGSRLLFSGYGVSPKSRSYQAGLLGADTLVLLDEAHLCAPFQGLLDTIARDGSLQPREDVAPVVPRLRLLPLSATGRTTGGAFTLTAEDRADPVVARRIGAAKRLAIQDLAEGRKLEEVLVDRARDLAAGGGRIAVFCTSREIAAKVEAGLRKTWPDRVALLVGARRVRERERLAAQLTALGFLAGTAGPAEAPAFLVATAAGEVGIDVDADHMACDLVAAERMIQRLGRVNRRGEAAAPALVDVVAAPPGPKADAEETAQRATWRAALAALPLDDGGRHDASPAAILRWRADQAELVKAATTPAPLRPALTRALADGWAMTSLADGAEHAGRPGIGPWLRGWEKKPEPQTRVAWRARLPLDDSGQKLADRDVAAFFEAAPPQASELLETETWAVVDWLIRLKVDRALTVAGFLLSPAGDVRGVLAPADLVRDNDRLERRLAEATVVLDARLGGLGESGLLDHQRREPPVTIDDATVEWLPAPAPGEPAVRFRVHRATGERPEPAPGWRERRRLEIGETPDGQQQWLIVDKWRDDATTEHDRSAGRPQRLAEHQAWTERQAHLLAAALKLPPDLAGMLAVAARLHDEGKRQATWQSAANAPPDGTIYAKTRGPFRPERLHGYRHEFGSLPLVEQDPDFQQLRPDLQDLALHLVAAHHGGARPFIATQGCDDAPPSALAGRATAVALRFARLQRRWGPWGLAWWEALLRAADQQASRENDEREDG